MEDLNCLTGGLLGETENELVVEVALSSGG